MTYHLPQGLVLEGRFAIQSPVGEGGMAVVYRARDLETEETVAVKLLHASARSRFAVDHFLREAEILASLRHPHIVSHIAHGHAATGEAYLALEWLEGEDLGGRLARGRLRVPEAVELVTKVAGALRATHEIGVVHRDLKPGNLFLRRGRVDQVTLLDFGVAYTRATPQTLTQPGVIVGTPEYMAPEQVRGEHAVGPAADIFSLGCVLFACLTGRPPFAAEQIISVLGKILYDEVPDIDALRPGIPRPLTALLAAMLAKEPSARPRDGAALLAAIADLPPIPIEHDEGGARAAPIPSRPSALRGELQELLSVIVASASLPTRQDDETVQIATRELLEGSQRDLLEALRRLGAHADFLVDGSLVAVLRQWSSATDQAALAVQAALLIQERWSGAHIAVATGRGVRPGDMPMGEALERAARLLAADTLVASSPEPSSAVRLDEVTAGLAAARFEVSARGAGMFLLRGPRAALDESRPLLGKPTPCVGRERELSHLAAALAATIDEPMTQAVLVLGEAGSGKSRLRHEFLRRLAAQGQDALVLVARGAPLSMGAAFGLIGQALRGLAGVVEGEGPEARRSRFFARIGERLPPARAPHVAAFLAEVSQIDPGEEPGGDLAAARRDPGLMQQELTRAFLELLHAECAARPVLLVLDDLHWGDAPSVRLLDAALRDLHAQPLFILALARPEVREHLPDLWPKRSTQQIILPGLGRRACERLIREALGAPAGPALEARIIAQAKGNALFLEELIRAAAEGKTEGVPGTVLAMLQARLGRLPSGARRALSAASVFGSVFWRRGVAALLGEGPAATLGSSLSHLIEQEIIERRSSSRLAFEEELGFRHDLVRDTAYSLLSEKDRSLGHYLAAQYLEEAGEGDALTLAEHYRLGGAATKASRWYRRAAEQALETNDLEGAIERAEKAMAAGAEGAGKGQLYGIMAAAASWQRDNAKARRYAELSLELLSPGTADWYQCSGHMLVSSGRLKDWEAVSRWLHRVATSEPEPGAVAALTLCLSRTGYMFMLQGRLAEMKQIAEMIAARAVDLPASEAAALAQLNHFRSGYALSTGDMAAGVHFMEATIAAFERAGDHRSALFERSNLACMYIEMGSFEAAESLCRWNAAECEQKRNPAAGALAILVLGFARSFSSFSSETPEKGFLAREALEEALRRTAQNRLHQGWARSALARLEHSEGRYTEAEAQARAALELTADAPTFQAWALAWLARALVRQGRAEEALAYADRAMANMKQFGGFTMDISVPPLAQIEALLALQRIEEAREAIQKAKRRILRRAERMTEAAFRARYLAHPDNAALLAMRGDERPPSEARIGAS